jgi:hypothetical protein
MAQNAMLNFFICTKHAAYDIVVGGIQCYAETKEKKLQKFMNELFLLLEWFLIFKTIWKNMCLRWFFCCSLAYKNKHH